MQSWIHLTSVTPDDTTGGVTRNGRMFNIPNHVQGQSFDSQAYEIMSPVALPKTFFHKLGRNGYGAEQACWLFSNSILDGQTDGQPIKSAVITADTEDRICNATPFINVTTLFRRARLAIKHSIYNLEDFFRILPTFPTYVSLPRAFSQDLTNYYVGSVGMQAWENWGVRGHIPADKKMDYGNYRAARQGERMLVSLMNIPFEHRLVILVGLAQDGLIAGAAFLGGAVYPANGGHNSGPHLAISLNGLG